MARAVVEVTNRVSIDKLTNPVKTLACTNTSPEWVHLIDCMDKEEEPLEKEK